MPAEYVKRAAKTPESETGAARSVVTEMLAEISKGGGEQPVRDYAIELDKWPGDIVVSAGRDRTAHPRGPCPGGARYRFRGRSGTPLCPGAARQRARFFDRVAPGLTAGQRLVPVNVAGCYVPTGRYAHIASAYMSVSTAQGRGRKNRGCLLGAL